MPELEALTELLCWTLFMGTVSVGFTYVLLKRVLCAATFYWIGWSFLIGGSVAAQFNSWYIITTNHLNYVYLAHFGALAGQLFATFIVLLTQSPVHNRSADFTRLHGLTDRLHRRYFLPLLIVVFAVGLAYLVSRGAASGMSLTELREQYNLREDTLLQRIGSHLSNFFGVFVILAAIRDSKEKLQVGRILILMIALAPFNLANATRLFLITYPSIYLISFFLAREQLRTGMLIHPLKELAPLLALCAVGLSAFALLGYLRGGYGEELDIIRIVLVWPVSTMWAFDGWVDIALASDRTYGLNTLGLIGVYGDLAGLIDLTSARGVMFEIYQNFERNWNTIAVIPRSIVPDIILDFGPVGVLPFMFILGSGAQYVSLVFPGRSVFGHSIATIAIWSSFMTIQMSPFSPGTVALLFWAFVVAHVFERKLRLQSEPLQRGRRGSSLEEKSGGRDAL